MLTCFHSRPRLMHRYFPGVHHRVRLPDYEQPADRPLAQTRILLWDAEPGHSGHKAIYQMLLAEGDYVMSYYFMLLDPTTKSRTFGGGVFTDTGVFQAKEALT